MRAFDMTLPHIRETRIQGNSASYEIGPLEMRHGVALGIALRRVLLSSLPGAAVTSLRIEGIQHEFQDIPNVMEDVTDIVLNVKKLRLRSFSDHPVSMRLEVSGEREVTAADIMAPSTVEIVNPDLPIATLDNEHARLDMELMVETGRGFVAGKATLNSPIGIIPVDAIYSPVQTVCYTVEQMDLFEKIVLDITTDGTISPAEALRQSAAILVRQFSVLTTFPSPEQRKGGVAIPPNIYETPLVELLISPRIVGTLKRSGLTKVGEILEKTSEELLEMRNMGPVSLQELVDCLFKGSFLPQHSEITCCGQSGVVDSSEVEQMVPVEEAGGALPLPSGDEEGGS